MRFITIFLAMSLLLTAPGCDLLEYKEKYENLKDEHESLEQRYNELKIENEKLKDRLKEYKESVGDMYE